MENVKSGKLLAIAIKDAKRAPMVLKDAAYVTLEKGVEGDHRGKPGDRQVTVISQDSWNEACRELNKSLPWTGRRANLLVEGVVLKEKLGYYLTIGELLLEITGETKPCERMDEFYQGLRTVLIPDWRGGVTCKVIKSGKVKINDTVKITEFIE